MTSSPSRAYKDDASLSTERTNFSYSLASQMKVIFLGLALVGFAVIFSLVITKKELGTQKAESSFVKYNIKDLPEHGISLIAPSDPSFTNGKTVTIDPYSVLLKNTSSRAVVGFAIKWECFDGRGDASDRNLSKDRNLSHLVSWVFLHGEESDRSAAVNESKEIIKPHSIWLISFDSPARPLDGGDAGVAFGATNLDESGGAETLEGCASVTVTADGIFFDDGTFVGPDTTSFFTAVKSQMDAQYEILRGVQNELRSGKNVGEVFTGLERIRDREGVKLGEHPTPDEFRSYFRSIFARDVLGQKELWGADKAIEDVQLQLSKPWVKLRKL